MAYNTRGTVAGVPVGWLHRPLRAIYTAPLVERGRVAWAAWRGVEPAGWFDIHATLDRPDGPERSAG